MNKSYIIKILLIGDSATGKSAIMYKYCEDQFNKDFISTIGIDFKIKMIEYQSKLIKIQIWDTAGQERFKSITSAYYRGADVAIICYDITNRKSFDNLEIWINDINKKVNLNNLSCLTIVGCKCDLEDHRVVTQSEGREFALKHHAQFFETSSKTNVGIDDMFYCIIDHVMHEKTLINLQTQLVNFNDNDRGFKINSKCC
jgi:small GTP-binding protein